MNIAEKLLEAQQSVEAVVKQGVNTQQNYKYAQASDVIGVCRKALHGAGLVPSIASVNVKERRTFRSKNDAEGLYVEVEVRLHVCYPADSEAGRAYPESATFEAVGAGADYGGGDKAILKAQTAATKYAYANALALPFADHDPEKDVLGEAGRPPKGTRPETIDEERTQKIGAAIAASGISFEQLSTVFGAAGADAPKIDRGDSKYKAVRGMSPDQADQFEAKLAEVAKSKADG